MLPPFTSRCVFLPQEVLPLDRSDVDSMIQETVASLVSAPCGVTGRTGEQSEISDLGTSTASAPARRTTAFSISSETESTDGGGRAEEESDGGERREGESVGGEGGEREGDRLCEMRCRGKMLRGECLLF